MSVSEISCEIRPDERVSLTDPRLRDCLLGPGTRITVQVSRPVERPSEGRKMRDGKPTAPVRPDPVEVVAPTPVVPFGPPTPEPVPSLVATVGAPTTAAGELRGLLPASGEASAGTLLLGLLAVLGGGAAWKFYSQRSRQQHELAMRELEIKAAGQGQPGECRPEHAAVREELRKLGGQIELLHEAGGNLTERVAQLEMGAADMGPIEERADLLARIEKLERAVKAAKGKASK